MDGKPESLLEKILKPIRINPVIVGLAVAGISQFFFAEVENPVPHILQNMGAGMGGGAVAAYMITLGYYFRDRKILRRRGFDSRIAKNECVEYCNRQAFYVASIEQGFRDEVKKVIDDLPNEKKRFHFIPHI